MAVSTRAAEAGKTFGEAVSAGVSAMMAPRLTRVVFHAGAAMAPALNAAAATVAPPARRKAAAAAATATAAAATAAPPPPALPPVEGLLVRVLPSPSAASVAVGDVVAFRAPAVSPEEARAVGAWPSEGQAGVLVRRVVASEGEQLLVASSPSSSEGEKEGTAEAAATASSSSSSPSTYSVPSGHCWVLADNESLPLPAARDSRAFGPLPYGAILGRVVYAAASVTDHRPILRGGSGSSFASSGGGSSNSGAFAGNGGSFASSNSSFAPASSAASRGSFDEEVLEAELDIRELAPPAPVS